MLSIIGMDIFYHKKILLSIGKYLILIFCVCLTNFYIFFRYFFVFYT